MRPRTVVLTCSAALAVVALAGAGLAASGSDDTRSGATAIPTSTAVVERGDLADAVSATGTLAYGAQADGSPPVAINNASGTFTALPHPGEEIPCGGVLYRVDDRPILLVCGTVPVYRALATGAAGRDVRQLNRNLHRLRLDRAAGVRIDERSATFTLGTRRALERLQRARGLAATGRLTAATSVVLPGAARIAQVSATLGGPARPGTPIATATTTQLVVRVSLESTQRGDVRVGARTRVTLPDNSVATGKVVRIGTVASAPDGQADAPADTSVPAFVALDDAAASKGFDAGPVQVEIAATGVKDVLSVPVAAVVGKSGGGYGVELVRRGGERTLVAVQLGQFDTAAGRVQVAGNLDEGDHVVVPAP
ncbi:MAG: hypothetical protein JWM98_2174 [Thermoleophilia bacterium]|nr:hypothetical protein [Thermoleophilia bacterium]